MKKYFLPMIVLAAMFVMAPTNTVKAADVGVSVSVGQPGFYGRIDIGSYPQPEVIYRKPVMVRRVQVVQEPVYMRVPPGHRKHWSKHCEEYGACGRPVYFVEDRWYEDVYVPVYREHHDHHGKPGKRGHHDNGNHGDHGNHGKHGR